MTSMQIPDCLFGLHFVRFKGRLVGEGLALCRYRLRDVGRLHRRFDAGVFQSIRRSGGRPPRSLLFFWLWLHRTFRFLYSITERGNGRERIIGFIGLYGIKSTQRVKLAVWLFDPRDRGRGYGRQALNLLLSDFRKRTVVNAVSVEVARQNSGAVAFFRKLGFQRVESGKEYIELHLGLKRPMHAVE